LISKKNIRYEGTLYSINELDATVALQNVRAFGTEGREKIDPTCTFVSPQDAVHPYLLFRGCDIKDLHVHESASTPEIPTTDTPPPTDPAILSTSAPPEVTKQRGSGKNADPINKEREDAKKSNKDDNITNPEKTIPSSSKNAVKPSSQPPRIKSRDSSTNKKGRQIKSTQKMIGTGASLLNRKARGAVEGVEGPDQTHVGDFDFESNLAEFSKVNIIAGENDTDEDEEDDSNDEQDNIAGSGTCVYTKDDFFDEISCDVLDKQNGIDNRLRGAAERSLNTETFGAVSLGTDRRGGRRNRRGRGGGRGGRGGGRGGRGRDFGRGGGGYDGSAPRENNRWKRVQGDNRRRGHGDISTRRTYGDGGLSRAAQQQFAQAGGER